MDKKIIVLIIGLVVLIPITVYAYESEGYLRAVEFYYKFTHGFYADPNSEYSKFLDEHGGSTMINETCLINPC